MKVPFGEATAPALWNGFISIVCKFFLLALQSSIGDEL
jgi:hypothetical protein